MNDLNNKIDNEIDILIDINKNLEKKENILFENMENIIKLHKQKNNFFLEKNNFFINNINISEELKIFLNITNNNEYNFNEIYNLFFDFLINNEILIEKNIINYDEKIEKLFNLNKKDILTFNNLNFHLQKHFI
tara:strand:+ start:333 stop:734 length:402 start_codon:yes stop_codon:yes gene_type:complete